MLDRMIKLLANIPHDKLLHSFYGTLIYICVSFVDSSFALLVVALIAIVKEVYDRVDYGKFDWKDIVATMFIPIILYIKEIY